MDNRIDQSKYQPDEIRYIYEFHSVDCSFWGFRQIWFYLELLKKTLTNS